jgi:hypothetical protein
LHLGRRSALCWRTSFAEETSLGVNTVRTIIDKGEQVDRMPLDGLPFEEAIDRNDAASPPIGVAEGRQIITLR